VTEDAFEPDLTKWDAWTPAEAAVRLAELDAPWYVAAGWALDLVLGDEFREHDDLEIAVPRECFADVRRALADFDLFVPVGAGLVRPVEHLTPAEFTATHQSWVREPSTGLWRLDVFREPSTGDTWVCRRDERIRLPFSDVIAYTADGVPYAQPEITLLYKAKHAREKDESDFELVLPRLSRRRRSWLSRALQLVHPGHRWLEALR
jgi:Aminoglycoside-2''-adenylyltransferase